ncbi:MAG: hypothetical protein K1X79_08855 [Oligoflexia bacterium]|nr:hypothetical protein [Oligoflexia bacterium]
MSDLASAGLEIHKLDEKGTVARRINCLPGRITVLRSVHPTESEMYQQALLGKPSAGRFTILFRGAPYIPGRHNLIGDSPDFITGDKKTVFQYLSASGVAENTIEKLLLEFSLGGLSQAACADLGPGQQRVLRLLAVAQNPEVVHVLVEPFAPLSEELREKVAMYLSDFVAKRAGIVVVTSLTVRPDAWIENEYISRAQLERPRTKTVGFGSDALNREELLAHMRQSEALSSPVASGKVLLSPPKQHASTWVAMSAVSICLALIGFVCYDKFASRPDSIAISSTSTPITAAALVKPAPAEVEAQVSHYPATVQEAVLKAFLRPDEVLQGQMLASVQIPTQNLRASFEQPIQQDSNQELGAVQEESQDDLEARREEIRQRFLEAIARASREQQQGTEWGN